MEGSDKKPERPVIADYFEIARFIDDMLSFLRKTERGFSVYRETQTIYRVSPTLVSLIVKGERTVTPDRVEGLARLLRLSPAEKRYLREWVKLDHTPHDENKSEIKAPLPGTRSREVGTHILNDWVNVYVKDCFQLCAVQENPEQIFVILANLASRSRIEKSLKFLLREGHLRRTPEGHIVVETNLAVADQQVSSKKVQQFHRGALNVAREAIFAFPHTERYANAMIIPLDQQGYDELTELIANFAEELKAFAEKNERPGERLYQMIVNLSPTGGQCDN